MTLLLILGALALFAVGGYLLALAWVLFMMSYWSHDEIVMRIVSLVLAVAGLSAWYYIFTLFDISINITQG